MRILILGNSGSGKSTLARRLGSDLDIPCFHMDRLFWNPRWQKSSDEELLAKVTEAVKGEDWVIDGNYSRSFSLAPRIERAHVALVLEVPVRVALWRVCKRWLRYMGRTRPDMGEGCREKWTFDPEFFKWIITWPQRKHRTYARLKEYPHLQVRVLEQHYDYAELLRWLRAARAEVPAAGQPQDSAYPC
jgi:adenylate kinase family enzyme